MSSPDSAPATEQRSFAARLSALPQVVAFARDYCARRRWPAEVALRLELILEELFTNTVRHGHRGDCAATIRIALSTAGDLLCAAYEDEAPPFDVVAAAQAMQAAPEPRAGARAPGGLGLRLVLGLAPSARYVREQRCNRVELTIGRGVR